MPRLTRLIPALAAALILAFSVTTRASSQDAVLTVAGGCFWCVEADFESVSGVRDVVSGYTGGQVRDPSYEQVTAGGTGHYEAVQVRYNPNRISYESLLKLFFRSIDPTDAGGQFCDRGDSYRTAIFVSTPDEKRLAEAAKAQAQQTLGRTVVTKVLTAGAFYPAEEYHQNYHRGSKLILTRFGPKRQAEAYKLYRKACGRDERIKALWGDTAPFIN